MVLTNVLGVAFTIRATLPHLLERGNRPLLDHELDRRVGGRSRDRLYLLGDEMGGDRDRRGAASGSSVRCTGTTASR